MSSSYAAAISALLSSSSPYPPIKRSPERSSESESASKSDKGPRPPRASQNPPQLPEPLGSYDEQQENPADYNVGR